MRSSPIYNVVNAGGRVTQPSFGAREYCEIQTRVGTSASNSKVIADTRTSHHDVGEYRVFRFGVDVGKGYKTLATKYMHIKTQTWYDRQPWPKAAAS